MNFGFHPEAELEFGRAVDYYEQCQPGLGLDFAQEVHGTIARICSFPEAWTKVSEKLRRCLVNRFPYSIIYQITESSIRIIAIANLQRKSSYWKKRVPTF